MNCLYILTFNNAEICFADLKIYSLKTGDFPVFRTILVTQKFLQQLSWNFGDLFISFEKSSFFLISEIVENCPLVGGYIMCSWRRSLSHTIKQWYTRQLTSFSRITSATFFHVKILPCGVLYVYYVELPVTALNFTFTFIKGL